MYCIISKKIFVSYKMSITNTLKECENKGGVFLIIQVHSLKNSCIANIIICHLFIIHNRISNRVYN